MRRKNIERRNRSQSGRKSNSAAGNAAFTPLSLPDCGGNDNVGDTFVGSVSIEVLARLSKLVEIEYDDDLRETIEKALGKLLVLCGVERLPQNSRGKDLFEIEMMMSDYDSSPDERIQEEGVHFWIETSKRCLSANIGKKCRYLQRHYPGLAGHLFYLIDYSAVHVYTPRVYRDYILEVGNAFSDYGDEENDDVLTVDQLEAVFPKWAFDWNKEYDGKIPHRIVGAVTELRRLNDEMRRARAACPYWGYYDLPAVFMHFHSGDDVTDRICDSLINNANLCWENCCSPYWIRFEGNDDLLEQAGALKNYLSAMRCVAEIIIYLDPEITAYRV